MALIPAILANAADLYAFTSFTFESPIVGRTGPTLSEIRSYYVSSKGNPSWAQNNAYLNMTTQGIQRWTVPATGSYQIEAVGAPGSRDRTGNGGRGTRMIGTFALNKGDILQILTGHAPNNLSSFSDSPGGGGGSFVVTSNGTALIIAGGGGGGGPGIGREARTDTVGNNGSTGSTGTGGVGGTDGGGGGVGSFTSQIQPSGGGGFTGNGSNGDKAATPTRTGGLSFTNGGVAGVDTNWGGGGGFGGGGAGSRNDIAGGGGGGGYSGGGGGVNGGSGGGGGSYNVGTNQTNTAGIGTGNGTVKITKL